MGYNQIKSLNDLITIKPFIPSVEQADIIETAKNGHDMVVIAFAGSGKTATAVETARASGRRGRMVVFNSSARRDAGSRMPEHIKVSTGHGLAHDLIIKPSPLYQTKLDYTLNSPRQQIPPGLIEKHLGLTSRDDLGCTAHQIATAILATLNTYLISSDKWPEAHHVPSKCVPMHLRLNGDRATAAAFSETVTELTRIIWNDMRSDRAPFPITHDGYVKVLHLREVEMSMPEEVWLMDEYQDTNPVLDSIISQQAGQKIYIGDPYQQIYSWRGAVNAMQNRTQEGITVKHLSRSFRFNFQVAGAANILLQSLGETVQIKGEPYNLVQMNLGRHHTVLVRNNLTMLQMAAEYIDRRQEVYVPGRIPKETQVKALSALALCRGRMDEVRIGALKELGSWKGFEDAARTLGDEFPEYQGLVNLVHQHGDRIPALIKACSTHWDDLANHRHRITMMTTHRAKGREWGYVRLTSDLALSPALVSKLQSKAPLSGPEREQVNLLYVAITRCKKSLLLPASIKQNLRDLDLHQKASNLSQIGEEKPLLSDSENRARTAAFIAKHRKA